MTDLEKLEIILERTKNELNAQKDCKGNIIEPSARTVLWEVIKQLRLYNIEAMRK